MYKNYMSVYTDLRDFFCPNRGCKDFRKKGAGNIVLHERYGRTGSKRLLRCRTCNYKFSERRMTFSFGLHTDEVKIREVIDCLINGKSFRETARVADIDKDTVGRIWKKFVSHCEESMDTLIKELNIELEDIITLLYIRSKRGV